MKRTLPALLCLTLTMSPCARAQEPAAAPAAKVASEGPALKMGDAAPVYEPGEWVQGEAVKAFDKDHAYLIECWATWCGPCIGNIPHVNELHDKFKDKGLVVIGQNLWERDADKVAEVAKKMNYRVVRDSQDGNEGNIATKWMKAAGRNGIPSAFLVGKDGKLAWIGHPAQLDGETISAVLAGTYDVAAAAAKLAEEEKSQAEKQTKMREISMRRIKALKDKNWTDLNAAIDDLEKLGLPTVSAMRLEALAASRDDAGLEKALPDAIKVHGEDPMWRHYLATNIIGADPSPKAIAIAEQLAKEGAASAGENTKAAFRFLDARILQIKGDQDGAIKLMEEVVAGETEPQRKAYFESQLKKMQENRTSAEAKPEAK